MKNNRQKQLGSKIFANLMLSLASEESEAKFSIIHDDLIEAIIEGIMASDWESLHYDADKLNVIFNTKRMEITAKDQVNHPVTKEFFETLYENPDRTCMFILPNTLIENIVNAVKNENDSDLQECLPELIHHYDTQGGCYAYNSIERTYIEEESIPENLYYSKMVFRKDDHLYEVESVAPMLNHKAHQEMVAQGFEFIDLKESKYVCPSCGTLNETSEEVGETIYLNNHCKVCKNSF